MESQASVTGADDALSEVITAVVTDSSQAESPHVAMEQADVDLTLEVSPQPEGDEHLLFWLGDTPYLVRLAELREALPGVPQHVALPFSPQWLWGIFPLRTDLVALVDPTPTLMYGPDAARQMKGAGSAFAAHAVGASDAGQVEASRALVVGEGDHLLALLTDRIGDICLLRAEDQRTLDAQAASETAPLPRYAAGVYTIAGLHREAVALNVATLVDDIFAALEERPTHE